MSEGWARPLNSRKYHYFKEGRSLCGNWLFLSKDLSPDDPANDSKDDCKACMKKIQKIRAFSDSRRLNNGK